MTALFLSLHVPTTWAAPDPAIYGQLPRYDDFAISPDGKHLAYIYREQQQEKFIIQELASQELVFVGDNDQFRSKSIDFATNDHVILYGVETRNSYGYRPYENSGALSYNLRTGEFNRLLEGTRDVYPAQTGLGAINGISRADKTVYMTAFSTSLNLVGDFNSANPIPLNLYAVHLDTGFGKVAKTGTAATIAWLTTPDARVTVREEFLDKTNTHRILASRDDDWSVLYEETIDYPQRRPLALDPDGKYLYLRDIRQDKPGLIRLSLDDSKIDETFLTMDDADIVNVVQDVDQRLLGARFRSWKAAYQFIDPKLAAIHHQVEQLFPTSSVSLQDLTADQQKMIFYISGPEAAGEFYLYDSQKGKLALLGKQYEPDTIAPVQAIRYTARDGRKLSAILTLPPGTAPASAQPAVVIAHNPYGFAPIRFNWLVQFLVTKGYLVIEPNVRGSEDSTLYPGEWGGAMQDDITDVVTSLAEAKYIDPRRTCILGRDYAGFSALAGGAFTPQLYQCVITINGVSDLRELLNSQRRRYGQYSPVVKYWQELIGANADNNKSPIESAGAFTSAVLLVHSKLNTILPVSQSTAMRDALASQHKAVTFVELEDSDSRLSTAAGRRQMLEAINRFLDQYNPVSTASTRDQADNQPAPVQTPAQ